LDKGKAVGRFEPASIESGGEDEEGSVGDVEEDEEAPWSDTLSSVLQFRMFLNDPTRDEEAERDKGPLRRRVRRSQSNRASVADPHISTIEEDFYHLRVPGSTNSRTLDRSSSLSL